MSNRHAHKGIGTTRLHKGLAEVFTPGRHKGTRLAEKVVLFSKYRGEELGRLQKLAIHRFHDDKIFDLRPEITDIPDRVVLTAYSQFFDELFFFGSLGGSQRFKVQFDSKLVDKDGEPYKFSEYEVVNSENGTLSQMYELVMLQQRGENRYYRLQTALSVLLQSMCQIFLVLWKCQMSHCSETWGKHGDGWAWQDMALAIEDALSDRNFLNLDIPLDRTRMLANALKHSPTSLKKEQLRKWRIDPKELASFTGEKKKWYTKLFS
ncbi:hypothetical protein VTL71DRAFT_10928 [Oculimacula yallundae]|uniref:Uncharacterized protein n=1 Tax=Oculimacula yallundae TaxID=86028 RepID=A0ABR4CUV8_9HELO